MFRQSSPPTCISTLRSKFPLQHVSDDSALADTDRPDRSGWP